MATSILVYGENKTYSVKDLLMRRESGESS
jgi:hypothetical protein